MGGTPLANAGVGFSRFFKLWCVASSGPATPLRFPSDRSGVFSVRPSLLPSPPRGCLAAAVNPQRSPGRLATRAEYWLARGTSRRRPARLAACQAPQREFRTGRRLPARLATRPACFAACQAPQRELRTGHCPAGASDRRSVLPAVCWRPQLQPGTRRTRPASWPHPACSHPLPRARAFAPLAACPVRLLNYSLYW